MKIGDKKRFAKSGNIVELISTNGNGNWEVERIDTKKRMLCNESALVDLGNNGAPSQPEDCDTELE